MAFIHRFVEQPCRCGHPKSWHQNTGPCVECYLKGHQNQDSGCHQFSVELTEAAKA